MRQIRVLSEERGTPEEAPYRSGPHHQASARHRTEQADINAMSKPMDRLVASTSSLRRVRGRRRDGPAIAVGETAKPISASSRR